MTALQQARAWFRVGDVLEQVSNTYIPSLDGSRRRVDHVGRSFYDSTMLDGPLAGTSAYRGRIPTRAGDLIDVGDEQITTKIGRDEHTITLRRVTP